MDTEQVVQRSRERRKGSTLAAELLPLIHQEQLTILGQQALIASLRTALQPVETTRTLQEAQRFVLTFGIHKGKPLAEVPEDYLAFLYDSSRLLVANLGAFFESRQD